jgi:WD40 repeat protein
LGLATCGAVAQEPKVTFKAVRIYPFQVDLAFSHDGALVGTCGDKVRVFDVAAGKLVREVEGPMTSAIAFSPAVKDLVAAGADDGVVRLFGAGKMGAARELRGHTGAVYSLAFDKAGNLLASGSHRPRNDAQNVPDLGQFRLWDVETGKVVRSIEVEDGGVRGVSFSADGKLVTFCRNIGLAGAEPTVDVYRVAPWEKVAAVTLPAGEVRRAPFGLVTRFLPDGKRLLVGGGVCVPVNPAEAAPYKSGCRTMGLLWSVDLGAKPTAKVLDGPRPGYYFAVGLSPDGARYATNGDPVPNSGSNRVEVRETDGDRTVWASGSASDCRGIAFSPDGKFVTHLRHGDIRLLDPKTGGHVRTIECPK